MAQSKNERIIEALRKDMKHALLTRAAYKIGPSNICCACDCVDCPLHNSNISDMCQDYILQYIGYGTARQMRAAQKKLNGIIRKLQKGKVAKQ